MSGNNSPQEQAAYKAQLLAQVAMYDKEIEFLSQDLQNHQNTIDKYNNFETQHPLFKKLVDVMVLHTQTGMQVIRNEIQEYQEYRTKAYNETLALNPEQNPPTV